MSRILTIIASFVGITVVIIAGYFVWQYLGEKIFVPVNTTVTNPVQNTAKGSIELAGNAALIGYSFGNGEVTGVQTDGQIVKIADGKADIVNSSIGSDIMSADFSYDGKKILIKLGSRQNPIWSVFDVVGGVWNPLSNTKIESAAWSPDSLAIAYVENVNGQSNIGVIDLGAKKTTAKTLAAVFAVDSEISWPTKNEIVLSFRPSDLVGGSIWKYKIKEKIFEPLAEDENGVWIKWAKDGHVGLKYSFSNSGKNIIVDGNGQTAAETNFMTLPDKCYFDESGVSSTPQYMYCAVPRDIRNGANLPDDYLKHAVYFNDDFYRVDLQNGKAEKIIDNPGGEFDATDILVSGNILTFINRKDNYLYQFSF